MSEINANIVVEPITLTVLQQDPGVTVTTDPISLNIYAAGGTTPGGNVGEIQYNAGGFLDGIPTATFTAGNLSLGNIANLKIVGGTNGYFLQTDGSGNLTFVPGTANITGNGTSAGSNNQIQLSDGTGNFKAATGFSLDTASNVFNAPGDANIVGNLSANIVIGNSANIVGNINAGNGIFGNVTVNTVLNGNIGNFTGNLISTGTTKIQQALEKITANTTAATGTINFDVLNQAILFNTSNASANFTLNIRGNATEALNSVMSSNQSITLRFINTNGNVGYYANVYQIDGSNITPKWVSNVGPPSIGTVNGIDVYDFEIIKTAANTYTVLGIQIGYT